MKNFFRQSVPDLRQAVLLVTIDGGFWLSWAFGCYQTVYVQQAGFTASQVGLLNAISSGVAFAAVPFWGVISDRIGSLRRVLAMVFLGGAGLFALTPLLPTQLPVSPMLLIGYLSAAHFFRGAQSNCAENLLVRDCTELHLNFGLLRSAGSLLFTFGSLTAAALFARIPVVHIFWISSVLLIAPTASTFFVREPNAQPAKQNKKGGRLPLGKLFRSRPYVMMLVFAVFYYMASSSGMNLLPYYMTETGISSDRFGLLLAMRSMMEVPFLLLMGKLRARIPLRFLVAAGSGLMAAECLSYGLFVRDLPGMMAMCALHGLGGGLFVGSYLSYVYELAPDDLKASAQAFFLSVGSVSSILSNVLGGMLFDAIGAKGFYLTVGLSFLLASLILLPSVQKKTSAAQ